ncbi:Caffeic acid 3-O-methyltransferase [Fusarium oxysporum f. sp. cubense race 1]|uniref:Caffeic acid 3-O-methyltransferase n=1 Tax=Fusarium oxysporum f. sp. cubense (strain race 1) TaxID=1229664 RepID=N4UWP5_FUSC1|nr:Caffeic acid 3-O-methyltransferase [Fusarium oxysporum f. sp. cubense race 1]
MSVYRAGNTDWWTFYPVKARLSSGFDTNISDVFLVDVGGGRGHDLLSFSNNIKPPGRLILQDLPEVIADVTDKSVFETQKHDFFTPQQVQHARAYFLHSILHDWSVEHGVQILKNLKPALKPGYSKVLINEIVLSEENPSVPATSMDMMMLGHIGEACERTEETFRAIVAEAGLEVVDFYSNAASPESVIEVMLPCSDSALEESKL